MRMPTLTQTQRDKIVRRASRAFDVFDAGTKEKVHRISDLTATTCKFRLRHKSGEGNYGGPKIPVERATDGSIFIPEPPPPPPPPPSKATLDLRKNSQLDELREHQGWIRAYKVTKKDGTGTQYGGITYEVGKTVEEPKADTNAAQDCAAGINLGTLEWVKGEGSGSKGDRYFAVEFEAKDVAAIPTKSKGKFRVFRCTVVEEIEAADVDMVIKEKPKKPKATPPPPPEPLALPAPADVAPADPKPARADAKPKALPIVRQDEPPPPSSILGRIRNFIRGQKKP